MNFLRRGRRGHNDSTYANNSNNNNNTTGVVTEKHHGRHDSRHDERTKTKRALFDINSGSFNRRPSFGQWLKMTWLDILTMAILGAVGLGVYNADPAPSRSFPISFSDGQIVYPEFAYPLRTEIVPIWAAALMASLIPILIILLMQFRIRSFWDVNNAIIGLLYSLITAAVFQVFIKWLIGGLRPHFLYVCAPDINKVAAGGQGYGNIMFQRDVCTGDRNEINDSLESMPSGHSTAAWAGFLYLYFYLNAKLKVWSNYHPAMWKIIVTYAPVLGAFLITGALTIDEFHNWYDCLAGAIIGSVMAISSYRMVYASVFDFRFNHIPLTRHTPFSFGAGAAGAGGFETAVFTRKAGWGYEEAYGGAPFDAAHHLRGAEAGFNTAVVDNSGHGHGHGHNRGTHSSSGMLGNSHGTSGTTGVLGSHGTHDTYNTHGTSNALGMHDNTRGTTGTGLLGTHNTHNTHNTHDTYGTHGTTGTGILGTHNNNTHGTTGTGILGTHNNTHGNTGTGILGTHNNTHGNTHGTSGMLSSHTHDTRGTSGITGTHGVHETPYNTTGNHGTYDATGHGVHDGRGMHNGAGGLGHRHGDVEHNAALQGDSIDDHNRYRMHSRSLERKAINRNSGGL